MKKKKCRNCHNLFLGAEAACPGASEVVTFIVLLRLGFELELCKPPMAFQFLARKLMSRDRLPSKFSLRMIHMYTLSKF